MALLAIGISSVAQAQVVDKIRLQYDSTLINSKQVSIAVSDNGQYIAIAYADSTVRVFSITYNKFVSRFRIPTSRIFDFKLSQTGDRIMMVQDSSLRIYDWQSATTLKHDFFDHRITRVQFLPDKGLVALGMMGGHVVIYDLDELRVMSSFRNEGRYVSVLALSPDGTTVAVGSIQKLARYPLVLFDVNTGAQLSRSREEIYTSAFFDSTGDKLITSGLKVKKPIAKILTASLYLPAAALSLTLSAADCIETPTGTNCSGGLNTGARVGMGAAFAVGAYGIWRAFRSKTFISTMDGKSLVAGERIARKTQFAAITYYQQGTANHNLALMLTHTKAFDVYDLNGPEKIFTTTQEERSFKASIDLIGKDVDRIYKIGNSAKYLVNTYGNNINQIYDAEANNIVGYLFSDSNDDFAVISRGGRIEGTENSLSKIYWTAKNSNQRTYLEANFESGYTPKLLNAIINDQNLSEVVFEVDDEISTLPVLQFARNDDLDIPAQGHASTGNKRIKMRVDVVENPSQIEEIRLYQNSKLIGASPPVDNGSYLFDVTLTNAFGKENFFYAVARSKSGLESNKVKLVVEYDGATEEAPKLYLVSVGINHYLNSKYNLNYAVPDADSVVSVVRKNSSQLFDQVIAYSLRDDGAVKDELSSVMAELRSVVKEQDILVFYYAGHGVVSDDRSGASDFYIIPHDVTQIYGNHDGLVEKAVASSELKEFSASINAQKQIYILDACQSAGALTQVASRGGIDEEKAIAQLARSTGTFWITSTGSDQFAVEFDQLGHGVFTYALLNGLVGNADTNQDRKLTIRELSVYVENEVPKLSEQYKGFLQFPSIYSFGNDFPIATYFDE